MPGRFLKLSRPIIAFGEMIGTYLDPSGGMRRLNLPIIDQTLPRQVRLGMDTREEDVTQLVSGVQFFFPARYSSTPNRALCNEPASDVSQWERQRMVFHRSALYKLPVVVRGRIHPIYRTGKRRMLLS